MHYKVDKIMEVNNKTIKVKLIKMRNYNNKCYKIIKNCKEAV